MAVNCSSAARKSSTMLWASTSGAGSSTGILQTLIAQPEEVHAYLVPLHQVIVAEDVELVGLLPGMPVGWVVTVDEVGQVFVLEGTSTQREVLVGAEVIDPHALGPGPLTGGLPIKEEYVGFDALGVEDAGRKPEQGVHIALLQELATGSLPSSALEEHVVRNHDGRPSMLLEQRPDMLDEVELLVTGADPEIIPYDDRCLSGCSPVLGHIGDAALAPKGRIGQHHLEVLVLAGLVVQAIVHMDMDVIIRPVTADTMQEQIHDAQAGSIVHDLPTMEGVVAQMPLLIGIQLVVPGDVVMGSEQKAASAAGWIADTGIGLRGASRPRWPGSEGVA